MNKKNILQSMKILILSMVLAVGVSYVLAQQANNVAGPLNVGTSVQSKDAGLIIGYSSPSDNTASGGLRVGGTAYFDDLVGIGTGSSVPHQQLHVLTGTTHSVFTGSNRGVLISDDTGPRLTLENTSGGADAKTWIMKNESGLLSFGAMNDTGSAWVNDDILTLNRVGDVKIKSLVGSVVGIMAPGGVAGESLLCVDTNNKIKKCAKPGPVTGECGTYDGTSSSTAPFDDPDHPELFFCSAGTATSIIGSGPWTWTCINPGGVSSPPCTVNHVAAPTVPTLTVGVSNITATGVTVTGNVTNNGGASITTKGVQVCSHPVYDSQCDDGVIGGTNNPFSGSSPFSQGGNALSPNQGYYVRTYAINSVGTGYSPWGFFTTSTNCVASKTFTSSSTWTVPVGCDGNYTIQVRGGGGGGAGGDAECGIGNKEGGGGGGKGGYSIAYNVQLNGGNAYTVTVGSGGSGGSGGSYNGNSCAGIQGDNGLQSKFGSSGLYIAAGGGPGGGINTATSSLSWVGGTGGTSSSCGPSGCVVGCGNGENGHSYDNPHIYQDGNGGYGGSGSGGSCIGPGNNVVSGGSGGFNGNNTGDKAGNPGKDASATGCTDGCGGGGGGGAYGGQHSGGGGGRGSDGWVEVTKN